MIYLTRGATWDLLHLVNTFSGRPTITTACGQRIAATHPVVRLDQPAMVVLRDSSLCGACRREWQEERS